MADKKLNEVTTVNSGTLANVKNFLAVMNDGSIQQMSKEDMASVVGGLVLPTINTLGDFGRVFKIYGMAPNDGKHYEFTSQQNGQYLCLMYNQDIDTSGVVLWWIIRNTAGYAIQEIARTGLFNTSPWNALKFIEPIEGTEKLYMKGNGWFTMDIISLSVGAIYTMTYVGD